MKRSNFFIFILFSFCLIGNNALSNKALPLYYWNDKFINFGDYLSLKLVERIVQTSVRVFDKNAGVKEKKLLAIGSIMTFARDNDVIWGSGVNGKWLDLKYYRFNGLDVRAVRGPITRQFLIENFGITCPEVYGYPALLMPYFFPEFKRKKNPKYEYIIIPHYSEEQLFPKDVYQNVVYPTEPWDIVVEKIVDSKFVISSSLHGLVVAEAFGIPARLLKVTENEPLLKYQDYYWGTNRPEFKAATSIEEALILGGEPPVQCDLQVLYDSFPFECWECRKMELPFNESKNE